MTRAFAAEQRVVVGDPIELVDYRDAVAVVEVAQAAAPGVACHC